MPLSLLKFSAQQTKSYLKRDWTNQEVAELIRVCDILGQAGISLETDRGVSDEGDPWFVYIRQDTGDILTHLARIDGTFFVVSRVTDAIYKGETLRGVIETMLDQHPILLPRNKRTRFFSHPIALLSAFVASALLLDNKEAIAAKLSEKQTSDKAGNPEPDLMTSADMLANAFACRDPRKFETKSNTSHLQEEDRKFSAAILKSAQEGSLTSQSFVMLAVFAVAYEMESASHQAATEMDIAVLEKSNFLIDIATAIVAAVRDDATKTISNDRLLTQQDGKIDAALHDNTDSLAENIDTNGQIVKNIVVTSSPADIKVIKTAVQTDVKADVIDEVDPTSQSFAPAKTFSEFATDNPQPSKSHPTKLWIIIPIWYLLQRQIKVRRVSIG